MFRAAAFDPATVKVLCDAYDKARKSLHDRGQPSIVREVIAARLISLAAQGGRDADRLCEKDTPDGAPNAALDAPTNVRFLGNSKFFPPNQ